jgi:two-component system LytT family response regulator
MIKAALIDDETHCRESLSIQLEKYCPQVQLLAQCSSAAQGLQAIAQYQPDVVFLDVEMPQMNGFEMLQQLSSISFEVIFTTVYDASAIKALRLRAWDYLLKPIDKDELKKAVAKVCRKRDHNLTVQLDNLLEKLGNKRVALHKIALPTFDGFELVSIDHILHCQADSNYTHIVLKESRKILVSRTLKEIEELLEGHAFLRVHHSHLINLNEIVRYVRGEGGYVVMSDNTPITVSRSHKEALLKILGKGFY